MRERLGGSPDGAAAGRGHGQEPGPAREPGPEQGLSRRRMLRMSGLVGAAGLAAWGVAGCGSDDSGPGHDSGEKKGEKDTGDGGRSTAPPPEGVLGANFNGDPATMDFAELKAVSATWLRGFFPMRDADKGSISDKPQIAKLLTARKRGFGTVLSLKFPYSRQNIPTPGSPAWKTAFTRLERVLPIVMDRVDILVIGNEPFLETRQDQRDRRLNLFYEKLAQRVIAYRADHSAGRTRLYMGALNHLDWKGGRTGATDRWMRFVKKTKAIDGVDIHPHVTSLAGAREYLDYVLPRMRPEQKFLATEFSLVLLWKQHLTDPVSPRFARAYEDAQGKKVWEVLREATEEPFSQKKWDDFLSMTPWFADNRNYLRDQVEQFRRTGRLAVATYGVSQDKAMTSDFGAKKNPWMLNSLFCPYTVHSGKDSLPGRNRAWVDQFRALQKST